LLEAGFVQMTPDGSKRLYSLRAEPFQELDRWMGAYRRLWEARLDRLADVIERRKKSRKERN
jgi:hypothetical protein